MKVFLQITGKKTIPLEVQSVGGEIEYAAFQRTFQDYVQLDESLQGKQLDNYFVFEYYDDDFEGDVEVPINCKVLPSNKISLQFNHISPEKKKRQNESNGISVVPNLSNDVSMEEEPGKGPSTSKQLVFVDPEEAVLLTADEIAAMQLASKAGQKRKRSSTTEEEVDTILKWTVDSFPTPNLSTKILAIIANKELLLHTSIFVKEIGNFFMEVVPKSYRNVYPTFVSALILKYPTINDSFEDQNKTKTELADHLCKMLITFVNNNRNRAKRAVDISQRKRGSILAHIEKEQQNELEPKTKKAKNVKLPNSFEELQEVLLKKRFKTDFVVACLKLFKEERWSRLGNFEEVETLIKLWPCYRSEAIILEEFLLRLDLQHEDELEKKFEKALEILAKIFGKPIQTEREKLALLEEMEDVLRVSLGKGCPKAFTVEMTNKPDVITATPSSIDVDAPISITYVSQGEKILRTFIYTRNTKLFSVQNPTAFHIYKYLVGTYYAYDRHYFLASKNLLDVLDFTVLGKDNNNCEVKKHTEEFSRLLSLVDALSSVESELMNSE